VVALAENVNPTNDTCDVKQEKLEILKPPVPVSAPPPPAPPPLPKLHVVSDNSTPSMSWMVKFLAKK